MTNDIFDKDENITTSIIKEDVEEKINTVKEDTIEKIETSAKKSDPVEKKIQTKKVETSTKVVYSMKSGNIPGFGKIEKGYSKIESVKAKELVSKYPFIRFASEEETNTYVN